MAKATILVIEDDPDIQELLAYNLEREGYSVIRALSAEEGRRRIAVTRPELIVLDIMLPGIDGMEFLGELKRNESTRSISILMLTAKTEDSDIVSGLELGAEDYVTKPFSPRVLVARVRACLRRRADREGIATSESEKPLDFQGIRLDPRRHEASLEGERLDLSATEFAILYHLMLEPGRVFTRQQIIDAVKGPDYPVTERSVDVQILSVRKKLKEAGNLIITVRGIGYTIRGADAERNRE